MWVAPSLSVSPGSSVANSDSAGATRCPSGGAARPSPPRPPSPRVLEHQRARVARRTSGAERAAVHLRAERLRPSPRSAIDRHRVATGKHQTRVHARRRQRARRRVRRVAAFLPPVERRVERSSSPSAWFSAPGERDPREAPRLARSQRRWMSPPPPPGRRPPSSRTTGGTRRRPNRARPPRTRPRARYPLCTAEMRALMSPGVVLVFILDDVQRIRSSLDLRQPPPGARVVVRREVEVRTRLVHDVPGVGTARSRDESDGGVAVGGDAVGFRRDRPRRRSMLGVPAKREMHGGTAAPSWRRPRVAAGTARRRRRCRRTCNGGLRASTGRPFPRRARRRPRPSAPSRGQIVDLFARRHPALSDRQRGRVVVVHRNVDISRVRGGFQHDAPLARRLEVPVHLNLPRSSR